MAKQVYINLPVADLRMATAFYEALGFVKQPDFSDDNGVGMKWSNEIFVMLLTHEFYKKFIGNREVIDGTKASGALLALTLETKEDVQKFADTAKQNGGNYYRVDMGMSEDMMFGYEVQDPDGNSWEPVWMSPNFKPKS